MIPRCAHCFACGGCSVQHVPYVQQVNEKEAGVLQLFSSLVGADTVIHPVIACDDPWHYRNKMEFSFSQDRSKQQFLGLILAKSRGKVFNLTECHLVSPWFADLLAVVRDWWKESGLDAYHLHKDIGSLRTLMVREARRGQDRMVMLTVSGNPAYALNKTQIEGFVQAVRSTDSEASIFLRIQQQMKGSPTQFYEIHLSGKDHLCEMLDIDGRLLKFKISPTAFFQPNTLQAEVLYSKAIELLSLHPTAQVLDLYCGTATLSIALAARAGHVTGIEINPHAVFDAEANKELNQISNVDILCGDAGKLLLTLQTRSFDAVVVDPPRAGLDANALRHLSALRPPQILYISCNPKTQAENIALLIQEGYRLRHLQPVDQFPHTAHIENIALLSRE